MESRHVLVLGHTCAPLYVVMLACVVFACTEKATPASQAEPSGTVMSEQPATTPPPVAEFPKQGAQGQGKAEPLEASRQPAAGPGTPEEREAYEAAVVKAKERVEQALHGKRAIEITDGLVADLEKMVLKIETSNLDRAAIGQTVSKTMTLLGERFEERLKEIDSNLDARDMQALKNYTQLRLKPGLERLQRAAYKAKYTPAE